MLDEIKAKILAAIPDAVVTVDGGGGDNVDLISRVLQSRYNTSGGHLVFRAKGISTRVNCSSGWVFVKPWMNGIAVCQFQRWYGINIVPLLQN